MSDRQAVEREDLEFRSMVMMTLHYDNREGGEKLPRGGVGHG